MATQHQYTAEEVALKLDSLEKRLAVLEGRAGSSNALAVPAPSKRLSPKEFLLTKNIGSEIQRVAALAFYLERQEGISTFNVTDLEGAFRAAREKLPKNMNDAVNKNIGRGFFMEAAEKKDSKKAWQLTATGERFVETDMSKTT